RTDMTADGSRRTRTWRVGWSIAAVVLLIAADATRTSYASPVTDRREGRLARRGAPPPPLGATPAPLPAEDPQVGPVRRAILAHWPENEQLRGTALRPE